MYSFHTAKKRQTYDRYGKQGLKKSGKDNSFTSTDPYTLFQQFFGNSNPCDDMVSNIFNGTEVAGFTFGIAHQWQQEPPIEVVLELTLQELFYGGIKKMSIERQIVTQHGKPLKEQKEFKIDVQPGWKAGTTITYEHEGNRPTLGHIPSDVVIIIGEKEHENFIREDNDLKYKHKINLTLREALCGATFTISGIRGRELQIHSDQIISPDTVLTIKGRGMPILKHPGERGDLIISNFHIAFPKSLSKETIKNLNELLGSN